jgi:hypothetical protein
LGEPYDSLDNPCLKVKALVVALNYVMDLNFFVTNYKHRLLTINKEAELDVINFFYQVRKKKSFVFYFHLRYLMHYSSKFQRSRITIISH